MCVYKVIIAGKTTFWTAGVGPTAPPSNNRAATHENATLKPVQKQTPIIGKEEETPATTVQTQGLWADLSQRHRSSGWRVGLSGSSVAFPGVPAKNNPSFIPIFALPTLSLSVSSFLLSFFLVWFLSLASFVVSFHL